MIKVRKAATIASPGSTANLVKGVNGVLGPSASVKRRLSVRLNEVNTQREKLFSQNTVTNSAKLQTRDPAVGEPP